MLLKGKNAVITGCLKGIGHSTLGVFAREGANIWACSQNPDPSFESHIYDLSSRYDIWIKPIYFDLSDHAQIKFAAREIHNDKKTIDILVNIAGMTRDSLFHMTTIDQMKEVFEINFFSPMLFTQYLSKYMIRQRSGCIINVSSISAIDGNPGQFSYTSSKAALLVATKTLSRELSSFGIRVNALAPGVILTDMIKGMPDDIFKSLMKKSDLKHAGKPEEVSDVIAFLSSDLASYITGQIIRVDGGIG
ncbi:MAG: SDR family oxidoreductase [Methanospirillum sp.]|nr:SDR family oxidoreductase [Methanospirillum sp.]